MHAHLATSFLYALAAAAPAAPSAQIAATAPCKPGISFASLLAAVDIGSGDARLHIDKLYAICLPPPAAPSTSNYGYSPDEGGKLASSVKDESGQVMATYVWYAENISGLWELSQYKVLGGYENTKPLVPGRYTLEFSADGVPFYRFPFAVAAADNDDPYQPPGKRYFIEGPWNEYGNLFYQRNDPESSLQFTAWVQDRRTHPPQQTTPFALTLVRVGDGKTLGSEQGELRTDRQWRKLDLDLHPPGNPNEFLKAKALLAQDGAYRFELRIADKPYGTYPFTVAGGTIALQGRQLESTEPTTRIVDYLYGGRYRSWWLPRRGDAALSP